MLTKEAPRLFSRRTRLVVVGLLFLFLGGGGLLYVFVFASMVPPWLQGAELRELILRKMLDLSDAGPYSIGCVVLVVSGVDVVIYGWVLGTSPEQEGCVGGSRSTGSNPHYESWEFSTGRLLVVALPGGGVTYIGP